MSSIRDDFRALADEARSSAQGPGGLDVVTSQLQIVTRVWAGGQPQADGGHTDTPLDIVGPDGQAAYRARQLTVREVASSGGRFREGDVRVGPITPAYNDGSSSGGYTIAQLRPDAPDDATEILYMLTGGIDGTFALLELRSDRPFQYTLILRDRRTP